MRNHKPTMGVLLALCLLGAWLLSRGGHSPPSKTGRAESASGVDRGPGLAARMPPTILPVTTGELGSRRSYRLQSQYDVRLETKSTGEKLTICVRLRGVWREAVSRSFGEEQTLRFALEEPEVEVLVNGQAATAPKEVQGMRSSLLMPFYATASRRGEVREQSFRPGLDVLARNLLKSILAARQLVRPDSPSSAWNTIEKDVSGEYPGSYEQFGLSIEKRRSRYTKLVSAAGLLPVTELGSVTAPMLTRFELAEDGTPRSVQYQSTMNIDAGANMPSVSSEQHLSLDLFKVDSVDPNVLLSDGEYDHTTLSQFEGGKVTDEMLDRNQLGGATFSGLKNRLIALSKLALGPKHAALLGQLRALFRQDESAVEDALESILQGLTPDAAKLLSAALGGAATPAAQRALTQVASSESVDRDVRTHAISILGVGENPTSETATGLLALTRNAQPELRDAATLAVGAVAASQGKSGIVEDLLGRLANAQSDSERILYIEALGNAGAVEALPALAAALRGGSVPLQEAAAGALRLINDEQADGLLRNVLTGSAAPAVRRAALFAVGFRAPQPLADAIEWSVRRDPEVSVRLAAVSLLHTIRAKLPQAAELLAFSAKHDSSEAVRRAADSKDQ